MNQILQAAPLLLILLGMLSLSLLLSQHVTACLRLRRHVRRLSAPLVDAVLVPPPPRPVEPVVRPPVLALADVHKGYRNPAGGRVDVLNGVTLLVPDRRVTVILGASGSGKTTVLNLLAGLDTPDSGSVFYRGEPLPGKECAALREYRAAHVSLVNQDLTLITHLTAAENAALPLLLRGVSRGEALAQARACLAVLGLGEDLARRRPAQLSGGQKQRVAIARAFTSEADVILADEPTGMLDPVRADRVMKAFHRLSRRWRKPVVLVTHNVRLAKRYGDRLLLCTSRGLVDVTGRLKPRPVRPKPFVEEEWYGS